MAYLSSLVECFRFCVSGVAVHDGTRSADVDGAREMDDDDGAALVDLGDGVDRDEDDCELQGCLLLGEVDDDHGDSL